MSCLREVNFNKTKFSFEKEETETELFHAPMERCHRMRKCKASFETLRKHIKVSQ